MIKTPLSTVIGGVGIWTPGCTVLGSMQKTLDQLIKSMFANNEQGFAYDPNDLTTMWQDQAKLLPVTGEGQPVWHILDKSGNNNHAFATSSATRPILQCNATTGAYYLAFDGSDDFFVTNSIDFTSTDKVSLFAGVRKLSDVQTGLLLELGGGASGSLNAFALFAPSAGGANKYDLRNNVLTSAARTTDIKFDAPHSAVLTGTVTPNRVVKVSLRINGETPITAQAGLVGNLVADQMYIGRRGGTSLSFNGHIYSLIGVGRLTTDDETTAIEKELAKRTGVTLSV